jgi:ectoine hydroxylase-related dioxygenase (phytanoyl-CoA dioxygenase family)
MLSQTQRAQFDQHGYLIVENVIKPTLIEKLRREYAALIEQLYLTRNHNIPHWQTYSFEEKLGALIAIDPDAYEFIDISLPLRADLDELAGMYAGDAVFELLTSPDILDIAESIVGPEIISNPVQHARIKPPEDTLNDTGRGNSNMARTGWHQDAAVIVEDADDAPILTVWVAITDATREMGCMQAVPGSHRWPALGQHCPGRSGVGEIYIPSALVDQHQTVDLEVAAGGLVLLNRKTWHGAGPNTSDRIRWSFDLRYQPPGYHSGRECFPTFLARSRTHPDQCLSDPEDWRTLWRQAQTDIASGIRDAVFNERWNRYRNDPLCA